MLSIIIPTYNRSELLERTLESIKSQTSTEWECIIVDDFSHDNTAEVVRDFCEIDGRFTYFVNEYKKGAQGARNTGLVHSKYEWVMFFDSDNFMHPDFVEKMTHFMSIGHEESDVYACCSEIVDVTLGRTGRLMNPNCRGFIHDSLFSMRSYVDFNQGVIRKRKLVEIGGLDEDCPSMQEWDTHIRLSNIARYSMTDESLIDYFVGGKDAISSNKKREVIGRLYILKKHHDEWKSRPIAQTKFACQINILINKIDDNLFVVEKKNELRSMVTMLELKLALYKVWTTVSKLLK